MKIKKIKSDKRKLEVKGQGCNNDCKYWLTSKAGVAGCTSLTTAVITGLW